MEYVLDTSKHFKLNWEASGDERILQNIFNLIHTYRYEVAYDRTLGMDPAILDLPADIMIGRYIAEVFRMVEEYEPRAQVKDVKLIGFDDDGNIRVEVVVEI